MSTKKITDIPIKGSKCPVCKKDSVRRYKPFCSKHCADVDLGHWLTESYVVESDEKKNPNEDVSD